MIDKLNDLHTAGIYQAIALRLYIRAAQARESAKTWGDDLIGHGPAPKVPDLHQAYAERVRDVIFEHPSTARAAQALAEFAAVIAADRLIGEALDCTDAGETDAHDQVVALIGVTRWLERLASEEVSAKLAEAH